MDMRAELRAAKLLMVDREFRGEFTRLLALAVDCQRATDRAESVVRQALRGLLLPFPYHRTYGTAEGLPPTDVACLPYCGTGRRKPSAARSAYISQAVFLQRCLRLQRGDTVRVRFQQLTGPLMAKSVEIRFLFVKT